MAIIRMFFLSLFFTLIFPLLASANNSDNDYLQYWQNTYLNKMTPTELQYTANYLYLSYAIALVESKIRQFSTPISRLNQSVRTNIATYKNTADDLVMLKTLLDRLSYVTGARTIYMETLNTYTKHCNELKNKTIIAALTYIQLYAKNALRVWTDERSISTTEQLKNSAINVSAITQHLMGTCGLHKRLSDGILPVEIPEENEQYKSIIIHEIILNNNIQLQSIADNLTNSFNETFDYAAQIVSAGAEIYKQYYAVIHYMIMSPAFDKQYATTMFGMHDILPGEYKTLLPDADHVFEHMLQTTKLYTQTELLQQQ
jgi:hypothetical protein